MSSLKLFFSWSYFFYYYCYLFSYYLYHRWVAPNDKWSFFFPFFFTCSSRLFKNKPPAEGEDDDPTQAGVNKASKGGIIYGDYLQVEHALQDLFSINLFLIYCSLHFCFLYSFFLPFSSRRYCHLRSCRVKWREERSTMSTFLSLPIKVKLLSNFQNFQWKKT